MFKIHASIKVLFDNIKVLGVDRGVRRPVATSDGVFLGTSIVTPELQLKQAHLARAVSRKQEALRAKHGIKPGGSLKGIQQPNALLRAKLRLAKFLGKMARKRKDQAHKISRALVNNSADVIAFEALETKKMTSTKNKKSSRRLRRDILDISWSKIESFTEYKAQWANKMTVRGSSRIAEGGKRSSGAFEVRTGEAHPLARRRRVLCVGINTHSTARAICSYVGLADIPMMRISTHPKTFSVLVLLSYKDKSKSG